VISPSFRPSAAAVYPGDEEAVNVGAVNATILVDISRGGTVYPVSKEGIDIGAIYATILIEVGGAGGYTVSDGDGAGERPGAYGSKVQDVVPSIGLCYAVQLKDWGALAADLGTTATDCGLLPAA